MHSSKNRKVFNSEIPKPTQKELQTFVKGRTLNLQNIGKELQLARMLRKKGYTLIKSLKFSSVVFFLFLSFFLWKSSLYDFRQRNILQDPKYTILYPMIQAFETLTRSYSRKYKLAVSSKLILEKLPLIAAFPSVQKMLNWHVTLTHIGHFSSKL